MICKDKDNLHQIRKESLFKKPVHPEVTAFYKQMTELSRQWHNGTLTKDNIDDIVVFNLSDAKDHPFLNFKKFNFK
jgi:hypothetical protein